jgi:hypothetical protein
MTKVIVGESNGEMRFATLGKMKDARNFETTNRVRAAFWVPAEDSKNKKNRDKLVQRILESNILENPRLEDLSDHDDSRKSSETAAVETTEEKSFNISTFIKFLTTCFK